MATTSFDSVWTIGVTRMFLPIGATAAVWMAPVAGQVGWMIETLPGQTCEIYPSAVGSSVLNLNFGTTQTQAALAGFSAQGFWIGGATGAIDRFYLPGPALFYLGNSSGVSTQIAVMSLKGQGY